jgi:hypothetical protein
MRNRKRSEKIVDIALRLAANAHIHTENKNDCFKMSSCEKVFFSLLLSFSCAMVPKKEILSLLFSHFLIDQRHSTRRKKKELVHLFSYSPFLRLKLSLKEVGSTYT